jgi:hypothetical protein
MVAEMFTLAAHKNVEKGLPGFRLQQWYFFFCAAFFGYGRMLKTNLLAEVAENAWLPGVIGAPRTPRRRTALRARNRNPTAACWGRPTSTRRARRARGRTAAAAAPTHAAAAQRARAQRRAAPR